MEYIITDLTAGQQIIALDAIIEPLEYHLENTPNESIDWDDFIAQLADEIVPTWNEEKVQWWMDMKFSETEEYKPEPTDSLLSAITFHVFFAIETFLLDVVELVTVDDVQPTALEVLSGAIEYRQRFGVAQGYIDLAKAILN